ncbi:MAG: DUF4286 family protein [Muribaculaceae bacterium]|nr:DUF4286 family protein [Muribaculaceae bacterium]
MYLINTSFHAARNVAETIVGDVRSRLVPLMEKSSLFTDIIMAEILVEVDPECMSFTLQGIAQDLDKAMEWMQHDAQEFFNGLQMRYGNNVVHFTTPMRVM